MNSSGFSRIVVTFAVMILALYISLDVFAGGSNAFGKFYLYAMIGGFVVGLFAPKRGFFFLLFLTGYLDYFKRLMILDAGIRQFDLYYVLGIAPATMAGISMAVLYQMAVGAIGRRPLEGWIAVASIAAMGGMGALGILSAGGGFRALGDLVNGVAYLALIFTIPALFRTPEELRDLMKKSILIFVPSVLYYLYQSFVGFTWWEYKYLLSGFTVEVRQLAERVPRVFGTMNGAGAATVVYSLDAAILIFAGFWKYRDDSGRTKDSSVGMRVFIGLLFAFAAYRTFSRAGWIQGVIAAVGFWAFRSRFFTRAFYISGVIVIAVVAAFSGFLLKNQMLNRWTEALMGSGASAEAHQAGNLSTLNARLEGVYAITHDSRLWTPFGVGFQGKTAAQVLGRGEIHDAFSALLLKVGYIPLAIGGFVIFLLMRAIHRFVLNQPDGLSATLGAAALSCAFANFMAVTVNASALNNYPVNFYLYFDLGIVTALMIYHAQKEKDEAGEYVREREPMLRNRSSPYLRNAPPGPAGRFRPALQAHRD